MEIKKGDNVIIIAGKDRGKTGKIERVLPETAKVIVHGINIYKKHTKSTRRNPHGGILNVTQPIDISNTLTICPHCDKPTRIGHKITPKAKLRICRRCHESVDQE